MITDQREFSRVVCRSFILIYKFIPSSLKTGYFITVKQKALSK